MLIWSFDWESRVLIVEGKKTLMCETELYSFAEVSRNELL
jgi:hypothetical protein